MATFHAAAFDGAAFDEGLQEIQGALAASLGATAVAATGVTMPLLLATMEVTLRPPALASTASWAIPGGLLCVLRRPGVNRTMRRTPDGNC